MESMGTAGQGNQSHPLVGDQDETQVFGRYQEGLSDREAGGL